MRRQGAKSLSRQICWSSWGIYLNVLFPLGSVRLQYRKCMTFRSSKWITRRSPRVRNTHCVVIEFVLRRPHIGHQTTGSCDASLAKRSSAKKLAYSCQPKPLTYGSISPGRGKWSKCGIFSFFWSSALTKQFDFSNFSQLFWRDIARCILKILSFWS